MAARLLLVFCAVVALCAPRATALDAYGGIDPRVLKMFEPNPAELESMKVPAFDPAEVSSYPVVNTSSGAVRGFQTDNTDVFLGIPFAAPPVGDLRFRSPQPPKSWSGTRDALTLGNMCPQLRFIGALELGAEDCLYLNVFVPSNSSSDGPLPVLVWIYGGGYVLGSSYEFGLYDGKSLASRDVIVVSMNYRLGMLGFLALDQLRDEDPNGSTGNYALQDQVAGLRWVKENIAAFGGDPNQVTIAGESAGAFSVCWHLVSQSSKGLFRAAIMESGTCDDPSFFQSYDLARYLSEVYADSCGCNITKSGGNATAFLECLRSVTVEDSMRSFLEIINPNWPYTSPHNSPAGRFPGVAPIMPWGPAIDGTPVGLLDLPLTLIRGGKFNRVPLIIGTNNNEGTIFTPFIYIVDRNVAFPLNSTGLNVALLHFFNSTAAAAILEQYEADEFPNPSARMSRIMRDFFFVCSSRRVARAFHGQGVPSYVYHFMYKEDWIEYPFLGNYHSSELEFVFGNAWPPIIHSFSHNDAVMSDVFGTYWTSHVKYMSPNGPASADTPSYLTWPEYDPATKQNMVMDVPPHVEADYVDARCDFWDTVQQHE